MSTVLFAPADYKPSPRAVWNASDFTDVNDTVRGGSSKSSMTIVDASAGIDFAGFLDTTTLGGAGFASQSYSKGFPGSALDKEKYIGLRLVVASPPTSASKSAEKGQPGGGKGPVTKYVLNLKTELPKRRPDGRSESVIVYEAAFSAPSKADGECATVDAEWSDFHATYRGRPAEAKPLDPSQVKEWSIMARSNFEEQSGPFALRLVSLSAIAASTMQERGFVEVDSSYISSPEESGSGEYYGFALFIVATVVMILWVLWALVPDRLLQRVGIDWYPNREWAFLIPAWSCFAMLFAYATFILLNLHHNPPLDDLRQVIDSHTNVANLEYSFEKDQADHPLHGMTMAQTGGTQGPLSDDVYDLPPGLVSRERLEKS